MFFLFFDLGRDLGVVVASGPSVSICMVTAVPLACLEQLRTTGVATPHHSDDGLSIESVISPPYAIDEIIENSSEFKDFQVFRQYCGVVTGPAMVHPSSEWWCMVALVAWKCSGPSRGLVVTIL